MPSADNRIRRKWQHYGGAAAARAETAFFESFKTMFANTDYEIRNNPREFRDIYVNVPLDPKTEDAIFTPAEAITKHGVFPDYAITNHKTNRTIYVEVKRQDGWVEGKPRSAGRGNAHERSCKFFTPGLLRILRDAGGIESPALPFWTVFQGDITRDPCRVREITCWFDTYTDNFFFWREVPDPDLLFKHFDECIAPLLE